MSVPLSAVSPPGYTFGASRTNVSGGKCAAQSTLEISSVTQRRTLAAFSPVGEERIFFSGPTGWSLYNATGTVPPILISNHEFTHLLGGCCRIGEPESLVVSMLNTEPLEMRS